tara:strand:+ start:83 stop:739 length:657 start_codon:yes stop_codon:yes gene_type:complete
MKKLILIIALLLSGFISADVNPKTTCKMETPPTIELKQYQLDKYLFTSSMAKTTNVNGDWIDPGCYPRYFIVTNPYESFDSEKGTSAIEAWFRQEVLWEMSNLQYLHFLDSIASGDKKERYAIFQGSTYGTAGPFVLVFMTHPTFKPIFFEYTGIAINKDEIEGDSFQALQSMSIESVEAMCDRLPSNAEWPWNKVRYTFNNSEYTTTLLSKGSSCDE